VDEKRDMNLRFTLGELAVKFGCELIGDPDTVIHSISTLSSAKAGDISFYTNKKYLNELRASKASAVVLKTADAELINTSALIHPNPYATFARISQLFHPMFRPPAGIHASAVVKCVVPDDVSIAENVVIENTAKIDSGVGIGANSYIGEHVIIGKDTIIEPNVTIRMGSQLGKHCYIHPSAVIGADGFGQAPDVDGYVKIPQIGNVIIGDNVEIGACTSIDRGTIGDTVIGNGVKLDNHIQIGHNVEIGDHTVMAAQVGVAGSTKIGKRCMVGGQAGFVGHLTICDDVIVNGRTMVSSSITEKTHVGGGFPMDDAKRHDRSNYYGYTWYLRTAAASLSIFTD